MKKIADVFTQDLKLQFKFKDLGFFMFSTLTKQGESALLIADEDENVLQQYNTYPFENGYVLN